MRRSGAASDRVFPAAPSARTPLPREPRRHDAHYFDLDAAITSCDAAENDYARFREDELASPDPPF